MTTHKFAIVGGQAIVKAGTYHFIGATSTSVSMVGSSPIAGGDAQEFLLHHVGGDAAVLSLVAGGNDFWFDPALTGNAEANSTPVNLHTLGTLKMTKGQSALIRLYNRVWTQALITYGTQQGRVRNVAASGSFALTDGVLRDDTSAASHIQALPAAASSFINGCGLILTLKKPVAANTSTLKGAVAAETIDGAVSIDLTAAGSSITVQAYGDATGVGVGWMVLSKVGS